MVRIRRSLAVIAISLASLSVQVGARAESFTLADRVLRVDAVEGYCVANRASPSGKAIYDALDNKPQRATVLSVQAGCDELARYQRKEISLGEVNPSYVVIVGLDHGQVRPIQVARIEYIEKSDEMIKGQFPARLYELDGDKAVLQRPALKKAINGAAGAATKGAVVLGVLSRDSSAVYLAVLQGFKIGDQQIWVAAIVASTLVQGLPVELEFSATYANLDSYAQLLDHARRVTKDFVSANEAGI